MKQKPYKFNPNLKRYQDKYGDIWERINFFEVRRVSDGNIGRWMNGNGLTPVKITGYNYK